MKRGGLSVRHDTLAGSCSRAYCESQQQQEWNLTGGRCDRGRPLGNKRMMLHKWGLPAAKTARQTIQATIASNQTRLCQ